MIIISDDGDDHDKDDDSYNDNDNDDYEVKLTIAKGGDDGKEDIHIQFSSTNILAAF